MNPLVKALQTLTPVVLKFVLCTFIVTAISMAEADDAPVESDAIEFDFSRLSNIFERYTGRFNTEDLTQSLVIMNQDPINYEVVNKNLKYFAEQVTKQSDVVKKFNLQIDSNLTGHTSRFATRHAKWLIPYGMPYFEMTSDVEFHKSALMFQNNSIQGFNLAFNFSRGLGIRGITGLSYTDKYQLELGLKINTFEYVKQIFSEYNLEQNCKELSTTELNDKALAKTTDIDLPIDSDMSRLISAACRIATHVQHEKNFHQFLVKTEKDFATIESEIDRLYALDEALSGQSSAESSENNDLSEMVLGGLGRAAGEVVEFFTSTYKFRPHVCSQINPFCTDSLTIKLGADVGIAGGDGQIKITPNKFEFDFDFTNASRYVNDYDVPAVQLAYASLKTLEKANKDELTQLAAQAAQGIVILKNEINSWGQSGEEARPLIRIQ